MLEMTKWIPYPKWVWWRYTHISFNKQTPTWNNKVLSCQWNWCKSIKQWRTSKWTRRRGVSEWRAWQFWTGTQPWLRECDALDNVLLGNPFISMVFPAGSEQDILFICTYCSSMDWGTRWRVQARCCPNIQIPQISIQLSIWVF